MENVDSFIPDVNGALDCSSNDDWTYVLPFSAKSREGLLRRVRSLAQQNHPSYALTDLAYTLGCRRSVFSARGFLLARQCTLVEDLQEKSLVSVPGQIVITPLPIAMIFTGQGAQWPQMGLALFEKNSSFRASIQTLDTHLKSLREAPSWTIEQTLRAPAAESLVSHPSRSQPLCTALQIALSDLFRQWGIVPQLVVGHSSGEIAAAYAAGRITSYEAIAVAYYRGLVVSRSTFRGAMMAISMGEQEADAEIASASLGNDVRVACKNSPHSSTLSGNEDAIDSLFETLTSRKAFARKLHTNGVAYHSHAMANLGLAYQGFLSTYLQGHRGAQSDASMPRMVSSVTGKDVDATLTSHSSYWRANLESPVEFAKAISTALKDSAYHFIELGPHSTLELPLKQIHAAENVKSPFMYTSAIIRGTDSIRSSLNAVGKLFLSGHDLDFGRVNAIPRNNGTVPKELAGKVLTDLPRYPWQHDTVLWNESRMSTEYRFRKHSRHDLLGAIVPGKNARSSAWRNLLRLKEVPWLADHRLEENIVFPAAGYLAMAVEALSRISVRLPESPTFAFRSVHFLNILALPSESNAAVELFTDIRTSKLSQKTDSKTWYQFEISSVASSESTQHATGLVCFDDEKVPATDMSTSQFNDDLETVDPRRWYEQFATLGLEYGPHFQLIHGMHVHRCRLQQILRSEIQGSNAEVSRLVKGSKYVLHPAIIDALLQTGLIADSYGDLSKLRAGLPLSLEAFTLTAPDPKALAGLLNVRATASQVGSGTILFDLEVRDASSRFVASMHGVRMAQYVATRSDASLQQQISIYNIVWKPDVEHIQPSSYQAFTDYIHQDAALPAADQNKHPFSQLTSLLNLIKHKNPQCRILEIDVPCSEQKTFPNAIRDDAQYDTWHQGCRTYARGRLGADGILTTVDRFAEGDDQASERILDRDKFDAIVSCEVSQVCEQELSLPWY